MENVDPFSLILEKLPNLVRKNFEDLASKYPKLTAYTKYNIIKLLESVNFEDAMQVDKSGDRGLYLMSVIFEAKKNFQLDESQIPTDVIDDGTEDPDEFGEDLTKCFISLFLFSKEIKGIPPKLINILLHYVHYAGEMDMQLNGENDMSKRLNETIAFKIKDSPLPPGQDLNVFFLDKKMPYPFHEDINKEPFVDLLYEFLITEKKLNCSKEEFVHHFIVGSTEHKITWLGLDLELPFIHKMMIGGDREFPGLLVLNTREIHKLVCSHFQKKDGNPFETNRLNATLSRGTSKERHPFLARFSNFLLVSLTN